MPTTPVAPSEPFAVSQAALDACAAEPIHTPGGIQPFGALLVAHASTHTIVQASANAVAVLGRPVEALLGEPLAAFAGDAATRALVERLGAVDAGTTVPCTLVVDGGAPVHAVAHRLDDRLLLECPLPASAATPDDAPAALDLRDIARRLRSASASSIEDFTARLVRLVREATGYDRVMVYRFAEAGEGEVIAEARDPALDPFLGLRYPASDIPPQARALYLEKRVRLLGDVEGVAVPLVPARDPVTGDATDLRHATLRAFSPVHLQYLRQMGVRATLVISVVRDGALWGLITCHHGAPRWLPPAVLDACDLLAEVLAVQVGLVENVERAQAAARVHGATASLRRAVAGAADWCAALVAGHVTLLDVVDAGGAAVVRGGDVWTVGDTPSHDDVRTIAAWVAQSGVPPGDGDPAADVLAVTALGAAAPRFAALDGCAAGVLAAEVSATDHAWLLWFRPEVVRTVRWGGAPTKPEVVEGGVARLAPRQSFAAWAHEVRGCCEAWTLADRVAAGLLRAALVEEVLHLLAWKHLMLRQDLVRVRQAVEASGEATAITDVEGRTLVANTAFRTLFGLGADDVRRGRAFTLPRAPFEDPAIGERLRAALADRARSWRIEAWVRTADQPRVPVELRIDRVLDDDGVHIGHVATFTDLRERHRAADERRALEQRMLQAQKLESLGLLAGGVAHDFNNLLTSILGYIGLAQQDAPAGGAVASALGHAETAAHRAAELCRQLLAYSGRGRFTIEAVDLRALIGEMRQLLGSALSPRAQLVVDAPATLPPIEGDATQLRQVVMNLLTNASDALGGLDGTIAVTMRAVHADRARLAMLEGGTDLPDGAYVELVVRDTGAGMDAATLARIFDPFFTTKFTGRGLGLAAVLGIVRGHRGALGVHSVPSGGTTFTLLLPVSAHAPRPADAPPAADPSRPGAGRLVLVVDDDAGIRHLAARALERAGFRVRTAADGVEGLAAFRESPDTVSVVVLDLVMPAMSGPETLAAIRALRPDARVLLSSGYDEDDALGRTSDHGASGFIQKPYRVTELVSRVTAIAGAVEE